MAIPKYDELFTDVLNTLSDGVPQNRRDIRRQVIEHLHLTAEEAAETVPSGPRRAESRVGWALTYLVFARAVSRPGRGMHVITELGKKLLADNPHGVTIDILEETDGLKEWHQRTRDKKHKRKDVDPTPPPVNDPPVIGVSPVEDLEQSVATLRNAVASEVLDRLRTEHWSFMERAVLKVLLKMGYGGDEDDLSHVGGPNDEGIDGIINQDKLGLEKIYVQSKRYKQGSAINGETVNAFMGAMGRKGVTKGVFITASHFTDGARKAAEENKHQQVILIDGEELAEIMVDYQIGVTEVQTYTIYKLDENFFED
jgi:restriction system protein